MAPAHLRGWAIASEQWGRGLYKTDSIIKY
ncbi:MAG: hypothetical protein ACJAXX_002291 [Roseivirga sp.]|jgi:hypothetical protein